MRNALIQVECPKHYIPYFSCNSLIFHVYRPCFTTSYHHSYQNVTFASQGPGNFAMGHSQSLCTTITVTEPMMKKRKTETELGRNKIIMKRRNNLRLSKGKV